MRQLLNPSPTETDRENKNKSTRRSTPNNMRRRAALTRSSSEQERAGSDLRRSVPSCTAPPTSLQQRPNRIRRPRVGPLSARATSFSFVLSHSHSRTDTEEHPTRCWFFDETERNVRRERRWENRCLATEDVYNETEDPRFESMKNVRGGCHIVYSIRHDLEIGENK